MQLINRITSMLSNRTAHTSTRRGRAHSSRSTGLVERFLHRR